MFITFSVLFFQWPPLKVLIIISFGIQGKKQLKYADFEACSVKKKKAYFVFSYYIVINKLQLRNYMREFFVKCRESKPWVWALVTTQD